MQHFVVGQRWMSETEPELGLGLLVEIQSKSLSFSFPQSQEVRTYGKTHPPVKRVRFVKDDELTLQDGTKVTVLEVQEREGVLFYQTSNGEISETLLSAHLQFSKPEERFLNGFIDSATLYKLRRETLNRKRELLSHPLRGLLGGKISLIPHQLYIAQQTTQVRMPRVLLADEVGLGKTIEASLMILRLILSGKAQRVLILLPDSLVHQWFFELYRKFSLSFTLINQETELEKGRNPFLDSEHIIASLGLIKGSEIAQRLLQEANFDLLVVDEAHALKVKGELESFEFSLVKELALQTPGLILLTATPEQFGEAAHFERLKLLDPFKFSDFSTYKKDKEEFRPLADLLKTAQNQTGIVKSWQPEIVAELVKRISLSEIQDLTFDDLVEVMVDRFGTGRMYFRNLRKTMDKEFLFFPKRILKAESLQLPKGKKAPDFLKDDSIDWLFEAKAVWLMEKIQTELKSKKILLICKTKKKILALEEFLKRHLTQIKIASFHSDLGLTARDRQAAYFADPDGAQILLCTEVGSEGRNFEFCQDLILFDLPLHPHPLEQRIGRLDRIGQKKDITLHLPYLEKSWEEVLLFWYHEALEVFERSSEASGEVFEKFKLELQAYLLKPDFSTLTDFLAQVKHERLKMETALNDGRDVLVEKNSFHPVKARQLHRELSKRDGDDSLSDYMGRIFEAFGVEVEDVQASTWYIRPSDNMFVPAFPHLDQDGKTMTFSRTKALEREDYDFMTWDHPMVLGAMDLILSENFGSTSLMVREKRGQNNFYLEGLYTVDCPAPSRLNLERFGMGEVLRILVDDKGQDLGEKFSTELIDSKIIDPDQEVLKAAKKFPKDKLMPVKRKADQLAQGIFEHKMIQSLERVESFYEEEIARLNSLSRGNAEKFSHEIAVLERLKNESVEHIKKSSWKLDSIRLIL